MSPALLDSQPSSHLLCQSLCARGPPSSKHLPHCLQDSPTLASSSHLLGWFLRWEPQPSLVGPLSPRHPLAKRTHVLTLNASDRVRPSKMSFPAPASPRSFPSGLWTSSYGCLWASQAQQAPGQTPDLPSKRLHLSQQQLQLPKAQAKTPQSSWPPFLSHLKSYPPCLQNRSQR